MPRYSERHANQQNSTWLGVLSQGRDEEAVRILQRRSSSPLSSRFVFPAQHGHGPARGLQKAWERIRARVGLDNVRIHDLRHSFASFAVASGASLYMVGKALGQSQSRTTERYAHLRDEALHAVAASVQESLFKDGAA